MKIELDAESVKGEALEYGEIKVSGPNVMPGYYKDLCDGEASCVRGEWLYTGDIGKRDKHGGIVFMGRLKNIIISRGVNILPEEIEREILCHPAVTDVLVYGEPDELQGEAIAADVVLQQEQHIRIGELHAFLRGRVATFKFPQRLNVVRQIVRKVSGKVDRYRDDQG